ncbi:molybdate ABC transporter permease subunit [Gulosibacter bifidus]|uniref:Molybdenum transport system permease n=1 Tax=Gulosibacter bifidus TaxID=272239 RepID=A0ABW5RKW4_9MICO|nr:molybdate ABC transporter permease subunit [Gulosibacter bifidus]
MTLHSEQRTRSRVHPTRSRTPVLVTVLAIAALASITLSLVALFIRVDWTSLPEVLGNGRMLSALAVSFGTAICATALCVIFGVPLGMWLARSPRVLGNTVRAIVLVPMLMPPLVGGLALLAFVGRRGLLGDLLASVGIVLPFTTPAVVIAQVFVAMPFLVIAVEQAHRAADPRFEHVARTLGASRTDAFWRVTLPMLRPAIVAGATMSFARALAEFGATTLFAGNVEGVTRTMPMAIYTTFSGTGGGVEEAYALAAVMLVAAIAVLIALRGWQPTMAPDSESRRAGGADRA